MTNVTNVYIEVKNENRSHPKPKHEHEHEHHSLRTEQLHGPGGRAMASLRCMHTNSHPLTRTRTCARTRALARAGHFYIFNEFVSLFEIRYVGHGRNYSRHREKLHSPFSTSIRCARMLGMIICQDILKEVGGAEQRYQHNVGGIVKKMRIQSNFLIFPRRRSNSIPRIAMPTTNGRN